MIYNLIFSNLLKTLNVENGGLSLCWFKLQLDSSWRLQKTAEPLQGDCLPWLLFWESLAISPCRNSCSESWDWCEFLLCCLANWKVVIRFRFILGSGIARSNLLHVHQKEGDARIAKQRFRNLGKLLSVGSLNWDLIAKAPGSRKSVAKLARINVQRYKTAAKSLLWYEQ